MDARKLFAAVPEDLSSLSNEELSALHAGLVESAEKIAAAAQDDATAEQFEFIDGIDDVEDQMEAGVTEALRLGAEIESRSTTIKATRTNLTELAAKVKPAETLAAEDGEDGDGDGDSDGGDGGEDPPVEPEAAAEIVAEAEAIVEEAAEVEPVVAAAPQRVRRPMPRPSAQHQAPDADPPGFVASSGLPGFNPGQRLDSKLEIAKALLAARNVGITVPDGFRQEVVVASLDTKQFYPEERRLLGYDYDAEGTQNWERISAVTRPNGALLASGGICAPVTPYYGQQVIATLDRPVRDALAGFNADRGGINFNPPIGIGTITGSDAIGIVTEAEDAEGGTFATKTCLTVECVGPTEVDVDIIFHCVTWSNLTARTFPERVAQFTDTVMAGFARLAETNLLNGIKANSTAVTQANTNLQGATSSLLGSVLTAAAGQRSRQRMAPDATLRALLPAWSRDLLVADIIRSQFNRFDMTEAGLVALLRSYNIEPSFYLDGPSSGTAQVFGVQNAGVLDPFPTEVQWALFPEGSHLFLDGGVLELGIVRDSVLNATNQFQLFGESFENTAFVGIESLWITTAVCPSGTVAAPIDNSDFCA